MSADVLRRAAEKLRRAESRLVMTWGSPWRVVVTDTESLTGVATCEDHQAEPFHACDNCDHFETYDESVAEYAALLHPPVALALAEMLERVAPLAPYWHEPYAAPFVPIIEQAIRIANEVLRGES